MAGQGWNAIFYTGPFFLSGPLHLPAPVEPRKFGDREYDKFLLRAVMLGSLEELKRFFRDDLAPGWCKILLRNALLHSHHDIAKFLLHKAATNSCPVSAEETLLHLAARLSPPLPRDVVELLIDNELSINAQNKVNDTPLHVACQAENEVMVQSLLARGASHSLAGKLGYTPLHWAAQGGQKSIVKILLMNKANVDAIDNWGNAPLHIASDVEVIKLLLEFNAKVNVQGSLNRSALHYASLRDNDGTVDLLLGCGVDISLEDSAGQTAFGLATSRLPVGQHVWEIVIVLARHIIMLKVAQFVVNKKDLNWMGKHYDSKLEEFERHCRYEMGRMKQEKLRSHFSISNILIDYRNPEYGRNGALMQALEAFNFDQFPIYQPLILQLLKRTKPRLELITSGQKSLKTILKISDSCSEKKSPALPTEILEHIVSHLSDEDLRNLTSCSKELLEQQKKC